MKILLLGTLLLNIGCATKTKWVSDSSKRDVSFKSGKIEIAPQTSHDGYSQTRDMLSVNAKITNKSDKFIEFDPSHITAQTESGETILVMSDQDIKVYTDRVGAMATQIVSGAFANPSATQNQLYVDYTSKMLRSGKVAPNSYRSGILYFAIPKAGSDSISFKFYESLQSNEKLVITKDKSTSANSQRNVASEKR